MQAYIWETWDKDIRRSPWTRVIAAFLLTTVTDALMRAARAGAYMMLATYTLWRVRRKVNSGWADKRILYCMYIPFPETGSLSQPHGFQSCIIALCHLWPGRMLIVDAVVNTRGSSRSSCLCLHM